ncbi:MAG TPA: hypothetical protein VMU45_01425 [Candidatus Eisenbacteria bacterium]|nr:hypothetical protein [Candidatus Eisenbacteria bacterium]
MASTSRTPAGERANLTLVSSGRRRRQVRSISLARRVVTTLVALGLLALVLKFLPPGSRNFPVQAAVGVAQAQPTDLLLSDVRISESPSGGTLYLDGLVTNAGSSRVTGATAEVEFHDAQGQIVASVEEPLAGISHGDAELVRDEFARSPIQRNEMRFFRIAVEQVPPTWNHEAPAIKIVEVKAK